MLSGHGLGFLLGSFITAGPVCMDGGATICTEVGGTEALFLAAMAAHENGLAASAESLCTKNLAT